MHLACAVYMYAYAQARPTMPLHALVDLYLGTRVDALVSFPDLFVETV